MTDFSGIARSAEADLEQHGWGKGDNGDIPVRSGICLGMAAGMACREPDEFRLRVHPRLQAIAEKLFPGRKAGIGIALFNDHPDTTREDISLVLKHLGELEAAE